MLRFALCLTLLAASGCRLERQTPSGTGAQEVQTDTATETLSQAGPPVAAGDTARVDGAQAARVEPVAPPSADARRAVVTPSGLAMPVVGVAPSDLVDTFEAARSEGRIHNALDILAPRGTPVVAVADGTVLRLFESDRGGLTVYHLGADGRTVYYYAHLDAWAPGLESDQTIRRGDAVGTVGDSGNAAPGNTHLHFAIWTVEDPAHFWDGEPVNPYGVLGGR